jgi:hypothetical protein
MLETGARCITVSIEFKNLDPVIRLRHTEIGNSMNFLDRHILPKHLHEKLGVEETAVYNLLCSGGNRISNNDRFEAYPASDNRSWKE